MLEMKYQLTRTVLIIAKGTYRNIPYWGISMGTHPCAYIELPYDGQELPRFASHGGVTYDEDHLTNVYDEADESFQAHTRRFVGWDYAHLGDHVESLFTARMLASGVKGSDMLKGKKYTTEEIVKDIKDAIDELLEAKFQEDDQWAPHYEMKELT